MCVCYNTVPGIDMVNLICTPVDIENECTVMWNVSVIRIYCITYILYIYMCMYKLYPSTSAIS